MQWQDDEKDLKLRRSMIQCVIVLMQKTPNSLSNTWMQKLPDLARLLEDKLYRQASSRDVYKDLSTLKDRLILLDGSLKDVKFPPYAEPTAVKIETKEPIAKTTSTLTPSAVKLSEENQKAEVLYQQQQRLLLLRHASKCTVAPGQCTTTPHCEQAKKIWSHIGKCKEQKCEVLHCVSSRFVLSHYHRCKDLECKVCAPLREVTNPSKPNAADEAIKAMRSDEQVQLLSKPNQTSVLTKRNHVDEPNSSKAPKVTTSPVKRMSEEELEKWIGVYTHCIQCMRTNLPCPLPEKDPVLKFGNADCQNMKNMFIHKGTCTVTANCNGCFNLTNLANLYCTRFTLNKD
jgi:E1A/CREB-binding protein